MSRIGDGSPYDPSHHVDWAYWACKGAPATIHPGAVVKMAEALEPFTDYPKEWYNDGGDTQVQITVRAEDIKNAALALAAYKGEDV